MGERVIRKNHPEIKSSQQSEISNIYRLHRIKFAAATKRAEELVNQPGRMDINDALDCGKFKLAIMKEMLLIVKQFFSLSRK